MGASKNRKTRAIAVPGTEIGVARYNLYREAYARINEALRSGFHLEAITIVESLVADRLESRLGHLLGKDFGFKTLGDLIAKSRTVETDITLLSLVTGDLDRWRIQRNAALHEIAKIADRDTTAWAERMSQFAATARQGLATLRKIDKRCKQLRKSGI